MHSKFPVCLLLLLVCLTFSTASPTPIQNFGRSSPSSESQQFSTTLKDKTARRDGGGGDTSHLLREFIAQFLRAMRMTLHQDDGLSELRARSAKLEHNIQSQGAVTSSAFQFPEAEQVKPTNFGFGSNRVNKGTVKRVPRPTPTITNIQLLTKDNINQNSNSMVRKAKTDPNSAPPTRIGKSSTIMSQPLRIVDGPRNDKRGRSLKEIEVQGVKLIVGERVPDSPEDKFFTWRNARVIKGVLVPNDNNKEKQTVASSGTIFTKVE